MEVRDPIPSLVHSAQHLSLVFNPGDVFLQQSAEMMKNMSPGELQRIQSMATSARDNAVLPPTSEGITGMPAAGLGGMADMLKDPKAIQQAMSMMKQMDEGQLANLMKMSQPSMSDKDALRMAQQMKSADDRVMGMVLGGVSVLAQAGVKLQGGKDWLFKNPSVLVAIMILTVALVLRYLGIM